MTVSKSKLYQHLDSLFLIAVLLCLFVANYTPGTYLYGWDNLMPELNIWLNLKRSLLAVWQQYQGLGLVGGMGHAADLIRQLILLPFILFLPASLIRYLWHFAMLALGAFGILFGLKKLKLPVWIRLTTSLFYLLHFGSIQNFYLPFEPFSTFWGFFPWLIFSLWNYLKKPRPKNFKKLLLLNILATPSFYVQTIFLVYCLCLVSVFLAHFLTHRQNHQLPAYTKITTLILAVNAFWLLPFAYFLKNDAYNPQLAHTNLMATPETILRNQRRGTLSDFLLLRGYYFDFQNGPALLMPAWQNHLGSTPILICGYLLAFFVLIGLVSILITRHASTIKLSLVFFFLLSCIALLSAVPGFSHINQLLRSLPLLNQSLRSPFTKFITPAVFSFSLLFAFGLYQTSRLISLKILTPSLLLFLTVFSFPAFQGNYIYPQLRQPLPPEYTQLFNFFKTQPSTARLTYLPLKNFWGWTSYRFGITGSGFIWYALPQPVTDPAFDVWNLKNQQYYQEVSLSLQKRDPQILADLFQKYSIEFIIFDDNISFGNDKFYTKLALDTPQIISQIPNIKLIKQFGPISVFQIPRQSQPYLTSSLPPLQSNPNQLQSQQLPYFSQNLIDTPHSQLASPRQTQIKDFIRLQNTLDTSITSFNIPQINFTQPQLLKITHRHLAGHFLKIAALQTNARFKFFETKLSNSPNWQNSWFYLPQMETGYPFYPGLNLIFINSSFTQQPTINDIKSIQIYPSAQIKTASVLPHPQYIANFSSNIFYYHLKLPQKPSPNTSLILPQTYHPGWLAFYLNGRKPVFLQNHQIFNSWANSWSLPQNTTSIYILFWPQLLQFLGLALVPLSPRLHT